MSRASTIEFSVWKLWIIQVELPFSHSVALSSLSLSPEYGYKKDTTVMILNKRQLYLIYKYLTGYHKIICQNMVLLVVVCVKSIIWFMFEKCPIDNWHCYIEIVLSFIHLCIKLFIDVFECQLYKFWMVEYFHIYLIVYIFVKLIKAIHCAS